MDLEDRANYEKQNIQHEIVRANLVKSFFSNAKWRSLFWIKGILCYTRNTDGLHEAFNRVYKIIDNASIISITNDPSYKH